MRLKTCVLGTKLPLKGCFPTLITVGESEMLRRDGKTRHYLDKRGNVVSVEWLEGDLWTEIYQAVWYDQQGKLSAEFNNAEGFDDLVEQIGAEKRRLPRETIEQLEQVQAIISAILFDNDLTNG